MNSARSITLDLVRHGEVRTPGLLCAAAEEPLSSEGWAKMRALKSRNDWDAILCSPSRRCAEFAAELGEHLEIPLKTDPAWRELDFGSWTGKQQEMLWQSDRDRLLRLWTRPLEFVAPDGEHMSDFATRVQDALQRLLGDPPGEKLLLITHAGVIRIILAATLGIDPIAAQRFSIAYAGLNRIRAFPDGEFSLLQWGIDTPARPV